MSSVSDIIPKINIIFVFVTVHVKIVEISFMCCHLYPNQFLRIILG